MDFDIEVLSFSMQLCNKRLQASGIAKRATASTCRKYRLSEPDSEGEMIAIHREHRSGPH